MYEWMRAWMVEDRRTDSMWQWKKVILADETGDKRDERRR